MGHSFDLWVPSKECKHSQCPLRRFDPEASSTFHPIKNGPPLNLIYGLGSANGTYGQDVVSLAGLTVKNQVFGVANSTDEIIYKGYRGDGLMGLGFPAPDTAIPNQIPFVFNLAKQKLIPEPVFSLYFGSISDTGNAGEMILGGIDHTKYVGELSYFPVMPEKATLGTEPAYAHWTVPGRAISTSTGFHQRYDENQQFVLDSGTSYTYVPSKVAKQIVTSLTKAVNLAEPRLDNELGGYVVDCALGKSKNLTVNFDIALSLNSEQTKTVNVPVNQLLDSDAVEQSGMCLFLICPLLEDTLSPAVGRISWLLGDSFLRSFYVVHDMGQKRVGLATAVSSSS